MNKGLSASAPFPRAEMGARLAVVATRDVSLRQKPTLPTVGLLAVTIVIGYEWLISGLVKFVPAYCAMSLAPCDSRRA